RHFLQHISQNKDNQFVTKYLKAYYEHAPYPSLDRFTQWTTLPINEIILKAKYDEFDKNPCAVGSHNGREEENGFKLQEARNIIKNMSEEVKAKLTDAYLVEADAKF